MAQMHIWSNGSIIFSHAVNDVDSISFSGERVRAIANSNSDKPTSLAGRTYYLTDSDYANCRYGYIFISDNQCAYFNNDSYDGYPIASYTYNSTTGEITMGANTHGIVLDKTLVLYNTQNGTRYIDAVYFLY
ncbi:MAG TPA: hypothetical protein DEO38_00790 [Bacteroidales bacterium]|jgi:hypothetical protein|nr:hypothetical protein [Bacteroidales bacterium]